MSSTKKILFTIPRLTGGGAERIFLNYMRLLDPENWNISLLLVKKEGVLLSQIPESVNILGLNKTRTRFSLFAFIKTINRLNPELIVSTSNYLNILLLFASFFIRGNPTICLYEPSMPSAQINSRHFPKYYFWLIKILYKRADYIIAQTEEMREEIIKYFSHPKKDIIVTINPLDESLIQSQLVNKKNPFDQEKINLIVSGRISEEKGQDVLVRAFKKVKEKNNLYRLNILGAIGDQKYYDKLKEIIHDLNLTEYINILGFKTNPYPYYKYADLLVLPSRWEGLPNVVLEALYLQTPVVVTNCIPYFKKLLNEGANGYIVDVDDVNGMAEAIISYKKLKVDKETVPKVNMGKIFIRMISNE